MPNRRTVVIVTLVVIGSLMIGLIVVSSLSAVMRRNRVFTKDELLAELNQISAPPGANAIHDSVIVKNTHVLVGKDYSFNGTYEDIRKHYDTELGSEGWRFVEERNLKNWSKDYGERDAFYCKQGMSIELVFNGDLAAQRGYLYSLNLSSGLNACNDK